MGFGEDKGTADFVMYTFKYMCASLILLSPDDTDRTNENIPTTTSAASR
jgi:hypothetical protein